jgi:CubicO group peptidase (beta-lactamase class C family)
MWQSIHLRRFVLYSACGITAVHFNQRKKIHSSCDSNTTKQFHAAAIRDIDTAFRDVNQVKHVPGILYGIMQNGKLIHHSAIGYADVEQSIPVCTETRFRIASMTKSFTAMAILKLREDKRLSLDDSIIKYIPIMSTKLPTDSPDITIRHLLTHIGGFPQDDPWADRFLDMGKEDFDTLLSSDLKLANIPGTDFEYSNLGYAILGRIIEVVSGESYQQYITREILKPLDMHDTTFELNDVPSNLLALGYRWEDEKWKLEPMLHDGAFGAMVSLYIIIACRFNVIRSSITLLYNIIKCIMEYNYIYCRVV